jgi:hypothetical protein
VWRSIAVVLGVVVAACNQSSASHASPAAPSAAALDAKSGGGPPTISLRLTVSNTDALGNASGITNDGQGDYVDGSQNVQAQLDSSGTLAFNTFTANHGSATRWVSYDFSQPVDPLNTFRPSQDRTQNYHFSTGPSSFSTWAPVQYLGTSGYPTSECAYMGNAFNADSSTAYRVSYHKGFEDTASSATSFAVFTRVSVTPAVWTVQPAGSCSPNTNIAALRSGDGTVLYGYYAIPFYFTLTAK